MDFVFVVLGLILLFAGGEALIRGSVAVSERLGISPVLIGVVIVGFGTSTPELLVSVQASLSGSPQIALGNVVGSNIANVMLILAIAATILPLACTDPAIRRDSLMVIAASALLLGAAMLGVVSAATGILMLALMTGYVVFSYRMDQRQKATLPPQSEVLHEREVHDYEKPALSLPVSLAFAVGGIGVLILGARLLVDGATAIARGYGVSEAVIGLSLVAVGTSLPELAASVIGALRRQTDMVVGNILGSNMYNILGILGIASLIKPIPVDGRMAALDIPIMLGVAILTAAVVFGLKRFGRVTGAACIVLYALYVWWMFAAGQNGAGA